MTFVFALIGLLAALDYQRRLANPESLVRSTVKTASTAALSLTALLAGAPLGLVLALALGAVGDLALSRAGTRAFLVGLVAFAVSHVVYIAMFLHLPDAVPPFALSVPAWIGALILTVLTASTALWLIPYTGRLRGPVVAYVMIIFAMGIAAFHLGPAFRLSLIGALLFLASDVILAIKRFRAAPESEVFHRASRWLWPLYWGGQALILLGIVKGLGLWVFTP